MKKHNIYKIAETEGKTSFKLGQGFDDYFPTIDDLCQLGEYDDQGRIVYSESDIAYLFFVMNPANPEILTDEQKKVIKYASELVYEYKNQDFNDENTNNEDESEAMKAILEKYKKK